MGRPSRSEARMLRSGAVRLAREAKSARLKERPEFQPIRIGAQPSSIFGMMAVCTCTAPDRSGFWARSGAEREWTNGQWSAVEASFSEWTKLTWAEIDQHTTDSGHKKHHGMPVEAICEEAQGRLLELDRLEADTIFRFRLGNKPRLWGFRHGAHFDLLWYDREHDVYPTDPA